jgi:hypothetical protein
VRGIPGAGSGETVVRNLAEYVAVARRLAARPAALAALQQRVRAARGPCEAGAAAGGPPPPPRSAEAAAEEAAAAGIWRVGEFTGRLEAGLRALWEVHAAGGRPAGSSGAGAPGGRTGPDAMHCVVPAAGSSSRGMPLATASHE